MEQPQLTSARALQSVALGIQPPGFSLYHLPAVRSEASGFMVLACFLACGMGSKSVCLIETLLGLQGVGDRKLSGQCLAHSCLSVSAALIISTLSLSSSYWPSGHSQGDSNWLCSENHSQIDFPRFPFAPPAPVGSSEAGSLCILSCGCQVVTMATYS